MHTLAPALSHTRGCGDNQLYTLTCVYALEYVKDNLFDAKNTLSRLSLFMSKHADLVRTAAPAMCVCVCKHVRTRVRVLLCVEGRGQTINEMRVYMGREGSGGQKGHSLSVQGGCTWDHRSEHYGPLCVCDMTHSRVI